MEKFLEDLKKLNLPKGKFAIFGSGPLAIRGLLESRDLDIIVTEDIFNKYKESPEWKLIECNKTQFLSKNEELELWKDWGPGEWNTNHLIKTAEIIKGLPFVRLEHVLKWKKLYGREKDKKHVQLIEDYLKNNNL